MTAYLTIQDVARTTGLCVRTVREAVHRGDLRAVRPRGQRRILIPRAAVDAWMEPVAPAPAPPSEPTPHPSMEIGSRGRLRALEGS